MKRLSARAVFVVVAVVAVAIAGRVVTREGAAAVPALEATPSPAPAGTPTTLGFDDDPVNQGAVGFAPLIGEWVVQSDTTAPSQPNVYAQVGTQNIEPPATGAGTIFSQDYADFLDNIAAYQVFPSTILEEGEYANLDLSVAYKPLSGKVDQSGGLLFRVVSPTDYYIWRCNVLEQDCRLWLYKDGQRTSLYEVKVPQKLGEWHRLRIVAVGDHIQGYLDDRLLMDFQDSTFASGRVGLWTKADAITEFDDFTVVALS